MVAQSFLLMVLASSGLTLALSQNNNGNVLVVRDEITEVNVQNDGPGKGLKKGKGGKPDLSALKGKLGGAGGAGGGGKPDLSALKGKLGGGGGAGGVPDLGSLLKGGGAARAADAVITVNRRDVEAAEEAEGLEEVEEDMDTAVRPPDGLAGLKGKGKGLKKTKKFKKAPTLGSPKAADAPVARA